MPATRTPSPRETARKVQQTLPRLDLARIPAGLESVPVFKELVEERRELMTRALHARSAAEKAGREVHEARKRDAAAFEQAVTEGKGDPGRAHEVKALAAAEDAQRLAAATTTVHNKKVNEIRAAINGKPGDEAAKLAAKKAEAALKKMRAELERTTAAFTEAVSWNALRRSITATRRADHVSIKAAPAKPGDIRVSGQSVDPLSALEALAHFEFGDES